MTKTLFVSDLDGTLLNEKADISDKAADILNDLIENGLNFTFATARTAASALKITEKLNLKLPCILMNGVSIYDTVTGRYMKNEYIKPENALAVSEIFKRHNLHPFMYKIERDMLYAVYSDFSNRAMKDFYAVRRVKYDKPFIKCSDLSEAADSGTVYFTILDSYEKLLPVKCEIEKNKGVKLAFYRDVYHKEYWFLEVFGSAASKYNAVVFLKNYGAYESITGFGDNLNDIPLFNACDRKIAVGNAKNELKDIADYVIGDNNSDSVALWIKDNYLKERI